MISTAAGHRRHELIDAFGFVVVGERVEVDEQVTGVLAPVETLDIETQAFATNWAKSKFTETGYDSSQLATGESAIADTTARWVTTDVSGVGPKTVARSDYEFGKKGGQAKKPTAGKSAARSASDR